MNHLKELIIEDLDKLSTHELGKVYKFIRMELIAEIPDKKDEDFKNMNFPLPLRTVHSKLVDISKVPVCPCNYEDKKDE
jgi:hypothetical protein